MSNADKWYKAIAGCEQYDGYKCPIKAPQVELGVKFVGDIEKHCPDCGIHEHIKGLNNKKD